MTYTPYIQQVWADDYTGTPPSAQRMAVIEKGIGDVHATPAARLFAVYAQTLATTVNPGSPAWSPISLPGATYDTDGMRDPTQPTRITIRTAGLYLVTGSAAFFRTASDATPRWAQLLANLSTTFSAMGSYESGGSGSLITIQVVAQRRFVVGDFIQLSVMAEGPTNPPAIVPQQTSDPTSAAPFLSAVFLAP